MMSKTLPVISKSEKSSLMVMCLPVLEDYLEQKNERLKDKSIHIKDAINSITYIKKESKIHYNHSFFILVGILTEFLNIEDKVKSGNLSFEKLREPSFWKKENIDINVSIFFVSTFLNELFRDKILDDFKKLEKIETVGEYIKFRNNIC